MKWPARATRSLRSWATICATRCRRSPTRAFTWQAPALLPAGRGAGRCAAHPAQLREDERHDPRSAGIHEDAAWPRHPDRAAAVDMQQICALALDEIRAVHPERIFKLETSGELEGRVRLRAPAAGAFQPAEQRGTARRAEHSRSRCRRMANPKRSPCGSKTTGSQIPRTSCR